MSLRNDAKHDQTELGEKRLTHGLERIKILTAGCHIQRKTPCSHGVELAL